VQYAVYLIVAVAIAAAILSIAVTVKAVLPAPEAPLEHAQALVFVKVRPLNGSYWLGVHAPYGDVEVRQVRVNNTVFSLGVTAPVGRDVWLNASGRPLTVACNSTVELVTSKGGTVRSLAFTVQCPVVRQDVYVHQLKVLERYAYNAIKYVLGFNETKITIRVRELGYVEVVNISPDPLLLVFDQAPAISYSYDWYPPAIGWKREYSVYLSVPPQGDPQYCKPYTSNCRPALGQPTWVQHVYLPPNGSVKLKVGDTDFYSGAIRTLISVYPAQYYYYNPANTTAIGTYLAAISPWRISNLKIDMNYTVQYSSTYASGFAGYKPVIYSTAVEFLNESGMPQVADRRNVVYKAYGGVQFYIDGGGLVWVKFPTSSVYIPGKPAQPEVHFWQVGGSDWWVSVGPGGLFCSFPVTRSPQLCGPFYVKVYQLSGQWVAEVYQVFDYKIYQVQTGPNSWTARVNITNPLSWTYYVSNAPNAYNYVLEASASYCPGGGSTKATLYKLDRYDWSKREKVAEGSYSIPCSGGSGSYSYTCSGVTKQYVDAADVKLANVTQGSFTFSYKWYYVLKDCDGRVVGSGYDIIHATLGTAISNIYIRDAQNPYKMCTVNEAKGCTMGSGQSVLTCSSCPSQQSSG